MLKLMTCDTVIDIYHWLFMYIYIPELWLEKSFSKLIMQMRSFRNFSRVASCCMRCYIYILRPQRATVEENVS